MTRNKHTFNNLKHSYYKNTNVRFGQIILTVIIYNQRLGKETTSDYLNFVKIIVMK